MKTMHALEFYSGNCLCCYHLTCSESCEKFHSSSPSSGFCVVLTEVTSAGVTAVSRYPGRYSSAAPGCIQLLMELDEHPALPLFQTEPLLWAWVDGTLENKKGNSTARGKQQHLNSPLWTGGKTPQWAVPFKPTSCWKANCSSEES